MRSIVAANWKMNLPEEGIDEWIEAVLRQPAGDGVEVVIAPPFPYLAAIAGDVGGRSMRLAGQNVSAHESGAFTGEVSPAMLRDVGCTDVIVGHSERRQLFSETDDLISRKLESASKAGLSPILCIGETREIRSTGKTVEHVDSQLKMALGSTEIDDLVVAYEPVWAIGTGENATTLQVEDAHGAIRKILRDLGYDEVPVLYGGSVKPHNAAELAAAEGVDGFLVGGASLVSAAFLEIIAAVADAR